MEEEVRTKRQTNQNEQCMKNPAKQYKYFSQTLAWRNILVKVKQHYCFLDVYDLLPNLKVLVIPHLKTIKIILAIQNV